MRKCNPATTLGLLMLMGSGCSAQPIDSILAHPPFAKPYSCTEHPRGQLKHLGDALGVDCMIFSIEDTAPSFPRYYREDGTENHHWFGWQQRVLSPCDCVVIATKTNPNTNEPGQVGRPPASLLVLKADDGTHFMVAHLEELAVAEGDSVTAGQAIATVGNNGYSRHPHIHLGAWRDGQPLQLRFDQREMED